MAGRPAARGGGMLYGMIAFVIATVLFLGLFIWQFTENQRYAEEAQRARRDLRAIGAPDEYYRNEAAARRSTAVDVMRDDLQRLAVLTVGASDAVGKAVEQAVSRSLSEIAASTGGVINKGDTLLTALNKMHQAHVAQAREIEQLQADITELRAHNERLSSGVKLAQDEFQAQVAALQDELQRVQTEQAETLAAKDEQIAQLQAAADSGAEELNRLRVEQQRAQRVTEVEVARKDKQIADLQEKIALTRPEGFDPQQILKKADGQVLRSVPGSEILFLNIGSRDGVRPGLTFEIFSAFGERTDEEFRGKASVEVTAVTDTTAEARVTRQSPGRPIVEGDVAVNIAYERNRKPKFVVRGDFDLNYDGTIDWDGADRVHSIIREWGGQIVDRVDETTDFVVIGIGPEAPDAATRRQSNAIFDDLVAARQQELAQYREVIEQARTYYIPIVTQNQFLFLTGFAGREDVLTRGG